MTAAERPCDLMARVTRLAQIAVIVDAWRADDDADGVDAMTAIDTILSTTPPEPMTTTNTAYRITFDTATPNVIGRVEWMGGYASIPVAVAKAINADLEQAKAEVARLTGLIAGAPPPDAADHEIARSLVNARAASWTALQTWDESSENARQSWITAVRTVIRPRLDALRAEVARLTTALATAEQARGVVMAERDRMRAQVEALCSRDTERTSRVVHAARAWACAYDGDDEAERAELCSAVDDLDSPAAAKPTPSPRFVAVRRDEVNGRHPVVYARSEVSAVNLAAACNADPSSFVEDGSCYDVPAYTHAVVDTAPVAPPATPSTRATCPTHGGTVTCYCTTGGLHCHECGYTPPLCDECDDYHDKGAGCAVAPPATPVLPRVEAFELPSPALEWLRDGGDDEDTFDSRTVIGDETSHGGCELHAQIYRDGSWDMTLTMPSAGSADRSKARVEEAVALLAGRAEVRR